MRLDGVIAKLAFQYYDALVVRAANANSPEEADALMRQAMTQRSEAVTGMPEVRIIDPRFHRSMQAMLATLDQDFDSSSESSDGEDDEEKEDEEDEEEGDNEGNEEPAVPVRPHVRRYPEPALVEIGIAMSLAPFESAGPKWTSQLVLVLRSRGIAPEDMEGLQHLLLDLSSRSGCCCPRRAIEENSAVPWSMESCRQRPFYKRRHVPRIHQTDGHLPQGRSYRKRLAGLQSD